MKVGNFFDAEHQIIQFVPIAVACTACKMSYHGSIIAFRKLRNIANSAIHSLCVMELRRLVQRPRQASGETFTQNHTHGTILGEELCTIMCIV